MVRTPGRQQVVKSGSNAESYLLERGLESTIKTLKRKSLQVFGGWCILEGLKVIHDAK